MLNGIPSSAASYAPGNAQAAAAQQTQSVSGSTSSTQATPADTKDSVTLSATAQAHAMQQQGMGVKVIAANMGVTAQAVDSYLGISSVTSGGGGGGTAGLKNIAAQVRVVGSQSSSKS